MPRRRWLLAAAIAACPWGAATAGAATLTVDDNRAECPAAGFTSVQSAVDAAGAGDVVVLCPGRYEEGTGAAGTNAVTIAKSLTLRGAGADLVKISPRATGLTGSSIAKATPDVRSGTGDIVAITGTPSVPLTVDISGVTIDGQDAAGRSVASEAGVVFLDAKGSLNRSRVTNVVTSEGATAYQQAGGWRDPTLPGYGVVQTSSTRVGIPAERRLTISGTRVDRYNRVGILIDGAVNDGAPFLASGVTNKGVVEASQVVGRVECVDFELDGDCSAPGLVTDGPLFGQDGIRVTNRARLTVTDSLIAQNLVNGTGAPTRPEYDDGYVDTDEDNANLRRGAGIRLLDAGLTRVSGDGFPMYDSSATRSNIVDNAYGVINAEADDATDRSGVPEPSSGDPDYGDAGSIFKAEDNWWGLGYYQADNPGPAIGPTTNPPVPENPVNGAPVDEASGDTTSDAVDFFPFRDGSQAAGQWPIIDAPAPISDAAPSVTLSGPATAARGEAITLTATPADDIGVSAVRLYDGAAVVATATTPPYALAATVPADAACGSVLTYTVSAEDTAGQTGAPDAPVAVTVSCPPTPPGGGGTTPPPGPPSVTLGDVPATLRGAARVTFTLATPAGLGRAVVLLGDRRVCTITGAPFACTVRPTGEDVGRQTLRVVVTDGAGATAEDSAVVVVPRFAARLKSGVTRRNRAGGRQRRTIRVTVVRPARVTAKQGCRSGSVTLVVKRGDRTAIDEQIRLTGSCVVSRAVTAPRRGAPFQATARFGGNAVLRAASTSRRFK